MSSNVKNKKNGAFQNIQSVLGIGATAIFANSNQTFEIIEKDDELTYGGLYSKKTITETSGEDSISTILLQSATEVVNSVIEERVSTNESFAISTKVPVVTLVDATQNPLLDIIVQSDVDADTNVGTYSEVVLTPKKGVFPDELNIVIEKPYKEKSGTYRMATYDDISNQSQVFNKTTTEINAISSPVEGEQYYNTTLHTICFYNGTSWQKVTTLPM